MRQRRWLDVVKDYDCEILYHSGKANVVADALSRKGHGVVMRVPLMKLMLGIMCRVDKPSNYTSNVTRHLRVTPVRTYKSNKLNETRKWRFDPRDPTKTQQLTVTTSLLELIRNSQLDVVKEDNQKKERIKGQLAKLVTDSRGLLNRSGRVWVRCHVRRDKHFWTRLIILDSPRGYQDVSGLEDRVLVAGNEMGCGPLCGEMSNMHAEHQRPHGELQPSEIPVWKWEHITMDLITKLPCTSRNVDVIWVIVDRLTKSAYFIAINESSSLEKLADIYIKPMIAWCAGDSDLRLRCAVYIEILGEIS
ncbi:LOW QUALITY PROTEIN: hypothetical protein OSB04_007026 [Centaurea solstitialis]|uniref:Reverse transcriptase domain-containing protein n=1 Tax=Centaurea solstitialis TaxID=347529 RepID=A0AA38TUM0_9ASTR|nr:LOW QUALITY PROTEIN: hypothetical protein OSB04_007026 [Centaurea solstitialis]